MALLQEATEGKPAPVVYQSHFMPLLHHLAHPQSPLLSPALLPTCY